MLKTVARIHSNIMAARLSALLCATSLIAGCAPGAPPAAPTAAPPSTTDAKVLAEAKANVMRNFAGTDRDRPTTGPAAQPGKTVWLLECSAQGAGCALPAQGAAEAGQALGWNMQLVDGKQDPNVYNTQIRAATAAGADAIILFGVDCAQVQASIEAAQVAGTKVFGANTLDCDDEFATGGGKPLFAGLLTWGGVNGTPKYGTFLDQVVGRAIADWVISTTEGQGYVLQLKEDDSAVTRHIGNAFAARIADCHGCALKEVPYTGAEFVGGKLQTITSTALQKYPQADVVMSPLDAVIALGAAAAVNQARESGRKILLAGQEGNPANIALLKDGTQSFAVGRAMTWAGWAAVDGLNRLFAGEAQVDPGIGIGSMDAQHLPPGPVYDGNPKSQGYQANYRRIWGVK